MNFNKYIHNEFALERQLKIILSVHFSNTFEKSDYYNLRCNVCGDSKKSRNKKRGYILKRKKPWMYYCHNCNCEMPVEKWMKEYFPSYYKDYLREILSEVKTKEVVVKNPEIRHKNNESIDEEKQNTKFFVPILKGTGELFDIAKEFCHSRLIPESIWHKWFVATNEMYKNRIIIPFYDADNKIYYYQGRSLYDYMIPKYLSRKDPSCNLNSIYNFYNIDKTKPVVILEGPIDSLFINNAVAITGLKIKDEKLQENLNSLPRRYYLLDNDEDARKKNLQLLESCINSYYGEHVFMWDKFLKANNYPFVKDINELCIRIQKRNQFTFEELEPFFTNKLYDKIYFM